MQGLHVRSHEHSCWHGLGQAAIQPELVAGGSHPLEGASDVVFLLQHLSIQRQDGQARMRVMTYTCCTVVLGTDREI